MSDDVTNTGPARVADLRPKTQLLGKIKKIELFGAFVDVGAEKDGLLHISQLRKEPTNRVEDVVSLGQEVTVWVRKTDASTGRIDLTMIEPLKLDWDEIKTGMIVKGKVGKLEKFGAFVDIGAERAAFIHVREMMGGRVDDPSEVLKVGQEVEAKVIAADRKKRRIDLSIKALDDFTPEEEEPEERPLTAMELALRQAMKSERGFGGAEARRRKKSKADRGDLEAVFERTRRQHVANK